MPIGPPPYPLCRYATSPPDRGSRPLTPFTGVTPWGGQNPSGARNQECLGAVPSGPTGGLCFEKIEAAAVPRLRLGFRTNAPGPFSAVGAHSVRPRAGLGPAPTRKMGMSLYPCRGGCPHPPAVGRHPPVGAILAAARPYRGRAPGRRALQAAEIFGAGGPGVPPLRVERNDRIIGTVPLIRSSVRTGPPSPRGKLFCTGSVGSSKPGAEIEPHQRQFLHTQGPVARREFRPITQIGRAHV